jgi:hypothetical protein
MSDYITDAKPANLRLMLKKQQVKQFHDMFKVIAKKKGSAEQARLFSGVGDKSVSVKMERGILSTYNARKILIAYKSIKSFKG